MTDEKITHEMLSERFALLRSDPAEYLRLAEALVRQNPSDERAYFSRYQAWARLGDHERALADLDVALQLEPQPVTLEARGDVLRRMGRYRAAVADFDRAEAMDPQRWKATFGPFRRAHCYAQLGETEKALVDCAVLPEDHWTPGPHGLPEGTKSEVIAQIKYIAAVARQRNSKLK